MRTGAGQNRAVHRQGRADQRADCLPVPKRLACRVRFPPDEGHFPSARAAHIPLEGLKHRHPYVHLRPGLPPVLPAQAGACQGGCQPVNQQDPGRDVKTQEHYNLLRGTRQAGESALIHRGKRAYPEHRTGVQPQENLPG